MGKKKDKSVPADEVEPLKEVRLTAEELKRNPEALVGLQVMVRCAFQGDCLCALLPSVRALRVRCCCLLRPDHASQCVRCWQPPGCTPGSSAQHGSGTHPLKWLPCGRLTAILERQR